MLCCSLISFRIFQQFNALFIQTAYAARDLKFKPEPLSGNSKVSTSTKALSNPFVFNLYYFSNCYLNFGKIILSGRYSRLRLPSSLFPKRADHIITHNRGAHHFDEASRLLSLAEMIVELYLSVLAADYPLLQHLDFTHMSYIKFFLLS